MKYLVNISRIFVGLLFIFSGLIKINDPVGFSFKLEEYFGPTVFNIDFLLPYVLPLAIFIVVLEVLLGVFLIIGLKKEFTIYSLFAMIVFFTFLTWYSARCSTRQEEQNVRLFVRLVFGCIEVDFCN